MRRALVVLGLLLSLLLAGTPARAITGNWVPDFEHEYVGLIVFYDAEGEFLWRCSGSLLTDTVFLTAGHCTTRTPRRARSAPGSTSSRTPEPTTTQ